MEEEVGKILGRNRGKGKKFFYLHGPPYVTNILHVGNMRNYVYQDVIIRYKLLRGFDVYIKPGLDTHGLPIEVKVEQKLGIKTKKDIERFGVENFIQECKKWVYEFAPSFVETYKKYNLLYGGFDLKEWYITCEDYYIEKAWKSFKKAFEKGLVYFGGRPVFWCPRCETTLANYEVTDSYTNLRDVSIYVKFPVVGEEKTYLLVWTTTPWTLPANVAIAVHPEESYVKVKVGEEFLIIAEKRLSELDRIGAKYEIVERFDGKDMDGMEYLPILETEEQKKIKHKVVMSIKILKGWVGAKVLAKKEAELEFGYQHIVSMEEGTGLVHIAPAHGREDFEIGKEYNLDILNVVDEMGRMINSGKYNGLYFREANEEIIRDLESKGYLLHREIITHRYPLCWRCKTPLVFRLSEQWFVDIQKIRERMIDLAKRIRFYPEQRKIQFLNWLANASDWAISRQRYWGIPIPIWKCENCGNIEVIESKKELEKRSGKKIKELHRPYVDVKIKCNKCGGDMERIPEIFDVWYDSGCAPFASVDDDVWEKYKFVDCICEAQDQIRGWFYTLHVIGTIMFDRNVYNDCVVVGWVLDEKGQKMSKSLGNVIFADEAIEKVGCDQIRFYYCYSTPTTETMNFSLREAKRIGDQFLNIFSNVVRFYAEYKKRVKFVGEEKVEDRWIKELSKRTIKICTEALENYNFKEYAEEIRDFIIEKLSRFYVKLIRNRVKKGDGKPLEILERIIKDFVIISSPTTPKKCNELYNILREEGLFEKDNVFLEEWPEIEEYDEEIIRKMEDVEEIISEFLSLREEKGVKWRWPLKYIALEKDFGEFNEIIKTFVNANEIRLGGFEDCYTKETRFGKIGISREIDREKAIFSEICRRIQEVRKRKGLRVYQKAKLYFYSDDDIMEIIKSRIDEIKEVCNFEDVVFEEKGEEIEIEDFGVKIRVMVE